jgi:polar amino acid transport system substrate-binding protein
MIELGRKSLAGKARSRPDLVKRFMEKASNEGLVKTFRSAMRRLNDAMPLGYSCAGEVVEVGSSIQGFCPGDLVACMGGGFASHSEYVTVPENLCAKIPESVSMEDAAFGMLGIIAMHAVRCANLRPGERVAVVGLGLLGLILVQVLTAYGFQVIATDLDEKKCDLCGELGVDHCIRPGDDFVKACEDITGGIGVDAVILAVATNSDKPVHDAVKISRFGGRIVVMGVADIHPHRNEMWGKEVELIVSKAGGPGIGDPYYEEKGVDYPIGYVRWTENRNLEEFLRLLAIRKVKIAPLITHRRHFDDALSVYEELLSNKSHSMAIGVVLQYPHDGSTHRTVTLRDSTAITVPKRNKINLGVIGGGMFARTTMLPVLGKNNEVQLAYLCTSRGLTANHVGKQHGFSKCTTDYLQVLEDEQVDAVAILTRHNAHAEMVCNALRAGKHVFVEKPLCINHNELDEIISTYSSLLQLTNNESQITNNLILMVGYSRRFSPLAKKLKAFFHDRKNPMVVQYRVNAGYIPPDHWVHEEENGRGRIIGEVCHMVDFLIYLTGSRPEKVSAERAGGVNANYVNNDNVVINLRFADGSIANITYSASGDRALARERMEAFCDEKTAVLTDFKQLELYAKGKRKQIKLSNQNMGYQEEVSHFIELVKGTAQPQLTPEEIFYSTRTVFCIHDSIEKGTVERIQI